MEVQPRLEHLPLAGDERRVDTTGIGELLDRHAQLSRRSVRVAMDLNHLNLRVRDAGACRDFYERHFGFKPAFDADGGHFIRNDDNFLLALIPAEPHQPLPDGFHIGFNLAGADEVLEMRSNLEAAGVRVADLQDFRPGEEYVTFRCWDPDGTEIEVFWEA